MYRPSTTQEQNDPRRSSMRSRKMVVCGVNPNGRVGCVTSNWSRSDALPRSHPRTGRQNRRDQAVRVFNGDVLKGAIMIEKLTRYFRPALAGICVLTLAL